MLRTLPHPAVASRYRYLRGPTEAHLLGCNILSDLLLENPAKVWTTYCGFLVVEGSGSYMDATGKIYPLKGGVWVQHIPGIYHSIRRDGDKPWVEMSISLSPAVYRSLVDLGLGFPGEPVVPIPQWHWLRQTLADLCAQFEAWTDADYPQAASEIIRILDRILRAAEDGSFLSRAKTFLSADLSRRLPLEKIGEDFGMNYHSFRRKFKQEAGLSPGEYRIRQRLEMAKTLLAHREYTIAEVADMLGYPDPFAFSKQFRAQLGVSPRDYRSGGF